MAYVADLAELSPVFAGALHHCLAADGSLGECGAPYALLRHDTAAIRKGNVLVPIRELCARVQSVCAVRFQQTVGSVSYRTRASSGATTSGSTSC